MSKNTDLSHGTNLDCLPFRIAVTPPKAHLSSLHINIMDESQTHSASTSPSSLRENHEQCRGEPFLHKRIELCIFVAVLTRYLKSTNQWSLLRQTRLLILASVRENRQGQENSSFYPLENTIEDRLRHLIDTGTWEKVKMYTHDFIAREQQRTGSSDYSSGFVQFVHPTGSATLVVNGATRMAEI